VSLVIDEHRTYLADVVRLTAFERAIAATVRPGDVVIDLGSGTGILGLLATRAGAARVYAVEETALGGLAREIAAANGVADRIRVIRGWSTWVTLPELADVVVSDQIGHFGIEAGMFEYFADARRRLLKPEGRLIPRMISWRCAPVECVPLREAIDFWRHRRAGFDLSPVVPPAEGSGFPTVLSRDMLLAAPATLASAAADALPESGLVSGSAEFQIERNGTLDGIGGWFVAELAPGVTFTNGPDANERIDRRQVALPTTPLAVRAGDRVQLRIRFRPLTVVVDWQVVVTAADGTERARVRRSTFQGMLIAPEDLLSKLPSARPKLSTRGEARRAALSLCDGSRTVAEIESELRRAYPEMLPTTEDASAFLSEVLGSDAS
jgi:protein arginine N-methyltransferase 1